jgi:hypothetical protein
MDARSVLLAHIRAAHDDVSTAQAVLENVAGAGETSAHERLITALRDRARDLTSLERDLADGADLSACWGRLRSVRTSIRGSLRDSLAFLGAYFVQREQLDGGYGLVARGLLDELAARMPRGITWPTVTLAVGDAFSPLTGSVWTRFPEFTVWALPMLGHEAGHVAVQEVKALSDNATAYTFPLVTKAVEHGPAQSDDGSGERLARELFADFFGAWTLGLAYACSAMLTRFNPRNADQPIAHHPPERDRVHLILQAIRRLDPGYADVAGLLHTRWSQLLAPFGLQPPAPKTADRLDSLVEELIDQADQHFPKVRFTGREAAQELAGPLAKAASTGSRIAPKYDIREVTNAAWIARLRHFDDPDLVRKVGRTAMAECLAVVAPPVTGGQA